MAQEIRWVPPANIPASFTKARIYVSGAEQGSYSLLAGGEIDAMSGTSIVNRFVVPNGSRNHFYVVKYYDPTAQVELIDPDYLLTYFPLTPREKRILNYVQGWIPEVFKPDLTEADLATSLQLAVHAFNVYPPETRLSIMDGSFPQEYEQFLVIGTMFNISLLKYLKLSIRDFSYSDMGFQLTIDRGAKISKAMEDFSKWYFETVAKAKFSFLKPGIGLGTIPLPISVGGSLNRGILNVLDIFTSVGSR